MIRPGHLTGVVVWRIAPCGTTAVMLDRVKDDLRLGVRQGSAHPLGEAPVVRSSPPTCSTPAPRHRRNTAAAAPHAIAAEPQRLSELPASAPQPMGPAMNIRGVPRPLGRRPRRATFYALDLDTYDGDSSACQLIGYGRTETEAVTDLLMQLAGDQ